MTLLSALHWGQPAWLWGCLLLPLLWFVPRDAFRAPVHCLIRTAVLLCVLLGLAQPLWLQTESVGHVVHVVDRSESVSTTEAEAAEAKARAALQALPERARRSIGESTRRE